MRASSKEREEFVGLVVLHAGGLKSLRISLAQELLKLGSQHGNIQLRKCNGYNTPDFKWDQLAADRDLIREERVCEKIAAVCSELDSKPSFGGDPRGNTVSVLVPSGYTNGFAGEGIYVPTS